MIYLERNVINPQLKFSFMLLLAQDSLAFRGAVMRTAQRAEDLQSYTAVSVLPQSILTFLGLHILEIGPPVFTQSLHFFIWSNSVSH